MKTLKPFYPIESRFPEFFKGMLSALPWDEAMPPAIRLDLTENDKAYIVKADIPGVKKEEIFVDVDGAVVTIRAEVKRETPEGKAPNALHTERFHGVLSRTFTLPLEVVLDATTAKYDNGVLTLTLPKRLDAPIHRVAIN